MTNILSNVVAALLGLYIALVAGPLVFHLIDDWIAAHPPSPIVAQSPVLYEMRAMDE